MVKPNFLIIGAAKSATTYLATLLSKHSDIFMCKPKEPNFFLLMRNILRGSISMNHYFLQ